MFFYAIDVIDGDRVFALPSQDERYVALMASNPFYNIFEADLMPPGCEFEYYDEDTMIKVAEALRENGYLPDDIPNVITSFQNRGILFRERVCP